MWFPFIRKEDKQYLEVGLSDILALIQVLALDSYVYRSENGLQQELQGPPRSSKTWEQVATMHPITYDIFRTFEKEQVWLSRGAVLSKKQRRV